MLNSEELRIGNYIVDNAGNVTQVILIGKNLVSVESSNKVNEKDARPIPLTEDWLEKSKLTPQDLGYYWLADDVIINVDGQVYCESEHTARSVWIAECNYVHQLQNLYFSLNGKELEVQNGNS